eukprot:1286456-Karenia_brevis.AAC.1
MVPLCIRVTCCMNPDTVRKAPPSQMGHLIMPSSMKRCGPSADDRAGPCNNCRLCAITAGLAGRRRRRGSGGSPAS